MSSAPRNEMGSGEFCHRCSAELPTREWAGEGGFFCPHCGAPQISLPEHMRMEGSEAEPLDQPSTTGIKAPPAPRHVDWQNALRYGGLVALIGGALTGVGTISPFISLLSLLWVVSGGVIVLSLYRKQTPGAEMNLRVGFRIGLVAGLLMTATLAIAFATAGVAARFGTHRMSDFDNGVQALERQIEAKMQDQKQSREAQEEAVRLMQSPEFRGGAAVCYLGFLAVVLTALSAGGGAFAGMLSTRRQGARGLL